jgi:hypothetical protein
VGFKHNFLSKIKIIMLSKILNDSSDISNKNVAKTLTFFFLGYLNGIFIGKNDLQYSTNKFPK